MSKRKTLFLIAVICTAMLITTSIQATAYDDTKKEKTTKKTYIQQYQENLQKYYELNDEIKKQTQNNPILSNRVKQIIRVVTFIIILLTAINPNIKTYGDVMTIIIKSDIIKNPLKIHITPRAVLLLIDGVILLNILRNIEK